MAKNELKRRKNHTGTIHLCSDGYYRGKVKITDDNGQTISKNFSGTSEKQVRDKINISDEIIITKNSQTINDFIDSTVPYQVIGDIDYSKNDIYNINIVTSFITIL